MDPFKACTMNLKALLMYMMVVNEGFLDTYPVPSGRHRCSESRKLERTDLGSQEVTSPQCILQDHIGDRRGSLYGQRKH